MGEDGERGWEKFYFVFEKMCRECERGGRRVREGGIGVVEGW